MTSDQLAVGSVKSHKIKDINQTLPLPFENSSGFWVTILSVVGETRSVLTQLSIAAIKRG